MVTCDIMVVLLHLVPMVTCDIMAVWLHLVPMVTCDIMAVGLHLVPMVTCDIMAVLLHCKGLQFCRVSKWRSLMFPGTPAKGRTRCRLSPSSTLSAQTSERCVCLYENHAPFPFFMLWYYSTQSNPSLIPRL